MASILMTSHFLTTMLLPLSWSSYFLTLSGNSIQLDSAVDSDVGRSRWLGMIELSLSNQKSESDVRSLPLSVMDCKPTQRQKGTVS